MRMKRRYTIGDLSKITGINTKTLRLYDQKGLLKPSERDEDNNYRYYSEQQVVDAVMIREMKLRGFSISEQKILLQTPDLGTLKAELENKIATVQQDIDALQDQLKYSQSVLGLVENALQVSEHEAESSQIKFEVTPARTVLFIRKKGYVNANQLFWDRYNELQKLREELQVTPAGPFSAIFHDHYFNQFFFEEGDLEVFLPIQEEHLEGPNIRRIGAENRASMVFVGWYAQLLATYVELVKQIDKSGHKIAGPAYEEYIVEFSYGVPENQCVTRVAFPVKPADPHK